MRVLAVCASLLVVIGISVWVSFSGFSGKGNTPNIPNDSDNSASAPSDEENIPPKQEGEVELPNIPEDVISKLCAGENYSRLIAILGSYDSKNRVTQSYFGFYGEEDFPDGGNDSSIPGDEGVGTEINGSQIEVGENQVDGVEEPDIFKMTDKYIFHIGDCGDGFGDTLRIYTLAGEESREVCDYPLPYYDGRDTSEGTNKMFLSDDGNSLIIIKNYRAKEDPNGVYKITLLLLDVSDVTDPKQVKFITVGGMYDFARISGERLILGTTFNATKYKFDWNDPAVYLPYYQIDDNKSYFEPEDIICPDEINSKTYSSIFVFDDQLNLTNSKAIFGVSGIYGNTFVSDDKIVYTMGYGDEFESSNTSVGCKTDITVVDYSGDELLIQGLFTIDGWIEDRYFIDEKDEYLRLVTNSYRYTSLFAIDHENSSLYIVDIQNGKQIVAIENFAPEGEGATAVRFDGDKCYVCTAEMQTYADPVYFFDLSDYNNITRVNTGFIDGFSTNLIDFGDGYLLGIGAKDNKTNKVSIYKREGDQVITVAEYFFTGWYNTDRKAYLIDRENKLFGFASGIYSGVYHLLRFDGENLVEIASEQVSYSAIEIRSIYYQEYLYIVKIMDLSVKRIDIQ